MTPDPVRILITGDRHWDCRELATAVVRRLVDQYGRGVIIVHGAAKGVDSAFARAADIAGIIHEPHPAQWRIHGPAAGPMRNAEMVKAGVTLCLAVHRYLKASKGTKDCARQAIAAGIPTYLIDSEDGQLKRITTVE